jgi:hypothetical protein
VLAVSTYGSELARLDDDAEPHEISNQNSVRIPVLNVPVIAVPKPFLIAASGVYVAALPATVPAVPVPALWPRVMVSARVVAFHAIVDLSAEVGPEKVTLPPVA